MQKSTNYNFNLPSRDLDDLADVNFLSDNFIEIDRILFYNEQDLKNKPNGTIVTEITKDSTDQQIPSAKAVNDALSNHKIEVDSELSATSENPVKNKVLSNSVANALKGSASGNPVALPDVSPLEHEIKVKLTSNVKPILESVYYDPQDAYEQSKFGFDGDGEYIVSSYEYDPDGDGKCFYFTDGSWMIEADSVPEDAKKIIVKDNIPYYISNADEIVDVNGATVQKYGKNLIPYPYDVESGIKKGESKTLNGVTYTDNGDGTITLNGTSTAMHGVYLSLYGSFFKDGVDYYFSGGTYSDGSCLYLSYYDENGIQQWKWAANTPLTWNKSWKFQRIYIQTQAGKSFDNYVIKPQVEIGAKTEYEQYKEPEPYTADENGNISIIGNGESMTLIAEDGVNISADYNRDINKAFAELLSKIETIGGAV